MIRAGLMRLSAVTVPQRWTNYGLGLLLAGILLAVGWVPIKELVWWLATRPEVGAAFQDPRYGRQDAWLSIFSFILLTPLVGLVMVWVLAFVYALPAGYVLPLGRRFGLPEWISTIFVAMASVTVIYSQSDVWLPPCLHALGLLARAFIVVFH
jgi:hypothetical protein